METVQSKPLSPAVRSWGRSILTCFTLALLLGALWWGGSLIAGQDPYVKEVLSIVGDASRGRDIFLQNCASCHGVQGAGHVGPSLHGVVKRRSALGVISQVTGGQTPPMPQFQPSPQAMADLLGYLEQLSPG